MNKIKSFVKANQEAVISAVGIVAVFAIIFFGLGGIVKAEASRTATVKEYEVLTVYQYSTPITNGYGGIRGHESMYHVTFIDENGTIHEKEMYNGASKSNKPYEAVYMSDAETKMVITSKGSTSWYALYLTEQDFQEMQYKVIVD